MLERFGESARTMGIKCLIRNQELAEKWTSEAKRRKVLNFEL
jgi:hypothetical protein